ncbi:MAG: membrane protease YdiL (CAAX protease family) [Cellvibrionaceae bacterium]|jgi:membrane protease YdiL (CAAX protease family)
MPAHFLWLVLIYPVLEEIVFRGLIQDYCNRKFKGSRCGVISYANFSTSIVFASAHLFHHSLLWSILAFFPSLLFGFARERYNNLTAPIVLHVFYNLGYYSLYR